MYNISYLLYFVRVSINYSVLQQGTCGVMVKYGTWDIQSTSLGERSVIAFYILTPRLWLIGTNKVGIIYNIGSIIYNIGARTAVINVHPRYARLVTGDLLMENVLFLDNNNNDKYYIIIIFIRGYIAKNSGRSANAMCSHKSQRKRLFSIQFSILL